MPAFEELADVRGDAGVYRTGSTISLKTGGAVGAPVVVRGVDVNGAATVRPVLVGTRTAPWVPGGLVGGEVFRLGTGARNLTLSSYCSKWKRAPPGVASAPNNRPGRKDTPSCPVDL